MKKRIVVLMTVLFLFFIPLANVFAYEGGVLGSTSIHYGVYYKHHAGYTYGKTNDGDFTTFQPLYYSSAANLSKSLWYEFSEPVDISSYQLFATGSGNLRFTFYKPDGNIVIDNADISGDLIELGNVLKGVTGFEVLNTSSTDSMMVYEFEIYQVLPSDITSLSSNKNHNSISFTWDNPTDSTGTKIYKDDSLLTTLGATENSFTDTELTPETTYNYNFVSAYSDGSESPGITQTITTAAEPPMPGITGLEYEPSYDSVSFSWDNPTSELFSGVEVYKNGELFTTLASTETTFSDSNLTPETAYTYEFIAAYSDGKTGEVATIGITTNKEPEPVLVSDGYEIDFSGDYLFKWTEPTTGTVKILIDGVEYDTVNAELQQVTIPKEEIKTDNLGNPLVSLVPVSAYGTIGQTTEVKGQNLEIPFSPLDLMNSGNGLLWYVAPFLLLALSFLFVPKVIRLIKESLKKGKSDKQDTRRFKPEEKEAKEQQEKREKQEREDREKRVKETKERNDKIKAYPELTEKPVKREREKRRLVGGKREREPRESFRAIREPRIKARTPKEPRAARRGRE